MKIYEKWTMTIDDGIEFLLFDGRKWMRYDALHELCGSKSTTLDDGTILYDDSSLFIDINEDISNGINKDNPAGKWNDAKDVWSWGIHINEHYVCFRFYVTDYTVKQARESLNLSRASLSRMLDIPIRTLEDWDAGKSSPPVWAERLVIEKLEDLFESPRVLSIPSKML